MHISLPYFVGIGCREQVMGISETCPVITGQPSE